MFSFTLNGQNYESNLSGDAVAEYLSKHFTSGFSVSLVSSRKQWGRWTERQAMWAHKLVIDHKRQQEVQQHSQPAAATVDCNLSNTAEFLEAVTTLKRVKLIFQQDAGVVSIKKRQGGGAYWVALNGKLCGKLNSDGRYEDRGTPVSVMALLDELEADPKGFTAEQGRKCGNCCFCGLPLTDERSLTAGFGPICAGHYNLPWG